jgi:predicted Zn-dependent protease
MHRTTIVTASVAILLALSVWGQDKPANSDIENIGRRDVSQGTTNVYSIDKEIAMGRQLSAVYEKQVRLNNDPELGEYINRLGQNIALNSDVRNLPVTFRVVESDEPGGMAFPGGFVFINSGTLKAVDNEAELAFALAQGVAHIAARHAARQASRGQIVNRSSIPVIYTGGGGNSIPPTFAQFSSDDALEADFLGVQYLYKAGYDPNAALTFLQKIQSGRLQGTPNLFNAQPAAAERLAAMQKNIPLVLPVRSQNQLTTPEFNGIKAGLKK